MEELNLDQDFLMRFSCMGTQDKDVLISQLHGLLDSQLSREGCAFFLDMTNWNLQAAVGAFYDHYSQDTVGGGMSSGPQLTVVERRSLQGHDTDSMVLPPRTIFTESWTLRNSSGVSSWPPCVTLSRKPGDGVECSTKNIPLPALPPGGETTLIVELQAPGDVGVYHTQWRARTLGGVFFGDPIWVVVRVAMGTEDEGVLGLANQLSTITTRETDMDADDANITTTARMQHGAAHNPFGSAPSSTPSSTAPTNFQEHPFGSGSMMSGGPGSVSMDAAGLERLLVQDQEATPISPRIATNIQLDHVKASADSTTCLQSQDPLPEWNSNVVSGQNQQTTAAVGVGGVNEIGSCSMMEEGNTTDSS